jgi:hypothetical protein
MEYETSKSLTLEPLRVDGSLFPLTGYQADRRNQPSRFQHILIHVSQLGIKLQSVDQDKDTRRRLYYARAEELFLPSPQTVLNHFYDTFY